ncbi:YeeE/YedE family protein [Azohydromonas aeria]|uniref:YeeE/YedE family protein n=1 Tax=Azohydromonas aeria TaxID=2590212 RepID=UPI0012F7DF26|nr:YeeE/YedE family protein [Azohydromonas aeria]
MNADADIDVLARWVVWGGFLLGLLLGAVGQSTRFCVRGAIADWAGARRPGRLLAWLLAVAVAAACVQSLIALGAFDASRTLAWSQRLPWLSCAVGGLLFGFGMMLGGGCPQRNLVKTGSGDLRALVTLLVTAVAALMTLRGVFAPWRANTLDAAALALAGPQDLGSLAGRAGGDPGLVRFVAVAALVAIVLGWGWRRRAAIAASHWIGGVAVGMLVAAAFLLTGQLGFVAEHPQTLEPGWVGTQSNRPEGLSFVAPLAHGLDLLTLWTDRGTVATFGVTLGVGVLLGSFASASMRRECRLQGFTDARELALHLAGGLLMGFGGITALGCTLGNGVTGLALLSVGALLATAGIVAGALLAIRLRLHHEGYTGVAQPNSHKHMTPAGIERVASEP